MSPALAASLEALRRARPLVHCLTNPVTINDCANILLAFGASPIMADAPEESAQVTARCQALVLNLGMLNPARLEAMLASGRQARAMGIPVVLDPVGVGVSDFRAQAAQRLLEEARPAGIRCNQSEAQALLDGAAPSRGVDAAPSARSAEALARALAQATGAVAAVTGREDVVSDGTRAWVLYNGHPMMAAVSGSGCMLSCLTAAFLAASPQAPLEAAAAAVCAMGRCGETAHARLNPGEGSGSFRARLLDAGSLLTPESLEEGARYEIH